MISGHRKRASVTYCDERSSERLPTGLGFLPRAPADKFFLWQSFGKVLDGFDDTQRAWWARQIIPAVILGAIDLFASARRIGEQLDEAECDVISFTTIEVIAMDIKKEIRPFLSDR